MLSRYVRTAGIAALAVVTVIAAAPLVSAAPKKNDFADRKISKTTSDGWKVTAVKANEKVRSVPPLNQSSWTREGFLSLRGEGRIAGDGKLPVNAGKVSTGFSIGCNTDVTSGATIGISAGPSAQMSISWPPALILGGQVTPNASTTLRPGTIETIQFGEKQMAAGIAGIELDGVHVKVDGCLGPVAVRAYTRVAISTAANDTTVHVYGKPHYL